MAKLTPEAKQILVDNYRNLLFEHGTGPQVAHYTTVESQFMRFEELVKIGDLSGAKVLEVGCGIGDFYGFLNSKFSDLQYTGIDIVPEIIDVAKKRFPEISFECRDVLAEPLTEDYDYVLISGVFNNAIPQHTEFLQALTEESFKHCKIALGFNFISTYVNFSESAFAYHNPMEVLQYCIDNLSKKVSLFHHYKRTDVCVFVYK